MSESSDDEAYGELFDSGLGEDAFDIADFSHTEHLGGGYFLLRDEALERLEKLVGRTSSVLNPNGSPPQECVDQTNNRALSVRLNPHKSYVWPSAKLMSELLLLFPELVRGANVIELGCGLGLPSLAAARAGARKVVATDFDAAYLRGLDKVVEINHENIFGANPSSSSLRSARSEDTAEYATPMGGARELSPDDGYEENSAAASVSAVVETYLLDWFQSCDEKVVSFLESQELDVCLCADVNYNPTEDTITALTNAVLNAKCDILILISREKRLGLEEFIARIKTHYRRTVLDREPICCERRGIGTCEDERHSLFIFRGRTTLSIDNGL